MVWIHGGGLTGGAGSLYDPSPLVNAGGIIVVTINYRLGVLGFLAQSGLDAEHHLLGNYGFMDQQFALKWVKKNIKAFGGNPKEVTIFGESAGGQSIYSQLASPLAKGLFRGAIAESGSYVEFQGYFNAILTFEDCGDDQWLRAVWQLDRDCRWMQQSDGFVFARECQLTCLPQCR